MLSFPCNAWFGKKYKVHLKMFKLAKDKNEKALTLYWRMRKMHNIIKCKKGRKLKCLNSKERLLGDNSREKKIQWENLPIRDETSHCHDWSFEDDVDFEEKKTITKQEEKNLHYSKTKMKRAKRLVLIVAWHTCYVPLGIHACMPFGDHPLCIVT